MGASIVLCFCRNQMNDPKMSLFFLAEQMSVLMVFCVPHPPLAFHFVLRPGATGRVQILENSYRASTFFFLCSPAECSYLCSIFTVRFIFVSL